ncbi:hypothetical protein CC2G_015033 [Coprinopsis cinerea AmutBmut pab1-1]|nr:hypothetical protein CC2G_015033 [Coprinopsis cinerea AmutBmut pab1-1]
MPARIDFGRAKQIGKARRHCCSARPRLDEFTPTLAIGLRIRTTRANQMRQYSGKLVSMIQTFQVILVPSPPRSIRVRLRPTHKMITTHPRPVKILTVPKAPT